MRPEESLQVVHAKNHRFKEGLWWNNRWWDFPGVLSYGVFKFLVDNQWWHCRWFHPLNFFLGGLVFFLFWHPSKVIFFWGGEGWCVLIFPKWLLLMKTMVKNTILRGSVLSHKQWRKLVFIRKLWGVKRNWSSKFNSRLDQHKSTPPGRQTAGTWEYGPPGKGKSSAPNHRFQVLAVNLPGCRGTKYVVVSNIFYFHTYLGRWSNLTSIFFKWVGSTTN